MNPSHERRKQLHRWSHTNVVRCDVVLRASCRDLPRLALGESRFEISQRAIDLSIAPLAFDTELWSPTLDDHEVDFPTVRVPEVTELKVTTLGILLVVDPFQKVARDEILESD